MNPGRLRERIYLQRVVRTPDDTGGHTESWNTISGTWAAVEPLQGRERLEALQTSADITHRVTIRYDANIGAADRWLFRDRVLEIVEPPYSPEERRAYTVMLCREGK